MNAFFEKLKTWWKGLSDTHRKIIIVGPLVFILLLVAFRGISRETSHTVLLKNIEMDKAAQAVDYLDQWGVDYQLRNGGRTILVPRSQNVNRLLLRLAEQNIMPGDTFQEEEFLKGGTFESAAKSRERQRIFLEKRLASTIKGYPQVESAKVLITPAHRSAFVRESTTAKAAVMLTTKSGQKLTKNQVNAIALLVANAVDGLAPEHVTITDQNGVLKGEGADSIAGKAAGRLEYKEDLERRLAKKAQDALDSTIGPNQANVVVNAEINFDERIEKITDIDENARVKLGEKSTKIKTERRPPLGGVPGVDSQLYERLPLLRTYTSGESRTEEVKDIKYDVPKVQAIRKITPGEIKRLSVALTLSKQKLGFRAPRDNYEYNGQVYQRGEFVLTERGMQEKEMLEDLVKKMVGFNEARGDTFTTHIIPFPYLSPMPAPVVHTAWEQVTQPKVLVPTMLVLAMLGLLGHYLLRRRVERRLQEQLRLAEVPSIEVSKAIQELAAQVVHSPEVVAETLREWMAEEPTEAPQAVEEMPPQPAPGHAQEGEAQAQTATPAEAERVTAQ